MFLVPNERSGMEGWHGKNIHWPFCLPYIDFWTQKRNVRYGIRATSRFQDFSANDKGIAVESSTFHSRKSYFKVQKDQLFTLSIVSESINTQSCSISKVLSDFSGQSVSFHGSSRKHELIGRNRRWTENFGRQFLPKVTSSCFTVSQNSCGVIKNTQKKSLFHLLNVNHSNFTCNWNPPYVKKST